MLANTVFSIFAIISLFLLGAPAKVQENQEPIATIFERLESQSAAQVSEAASQLSNRAKSDPKVKEYLAGHLPALIAKGPAQRDYPGAWIAIARLAGQLRIAEASPALAKWLTIDNIGEMTAAEFINLETNPAGKALAEIGDPAIPALTQVFAHGSLRERRYAVYVLRLINSPSAKTSLRHQMEREPDESLRDFVRKTLQSQPSASEL